MKILNLYSGIGGNRKLWGDEHQITAVEYRQDIADVYHHFFPNDKIVVADAHQYLLDHYKEFDFIWASPPCQTHSRMMQATRHKKKHYADMSLYQEIIFLKHFFNGKWVVENVKPYYYPLINPSIILGRHYFWSNFSILNFKIPKQPKGFITKSTVKGSEELKEWIGINYKGNIYYENNHCPAQVLRNCVHPETGLHILNCAIARFENEKIKPLTLF